MMNRVNNLKLNLVILLSVFLSFGIANIVAAKL